MDIAVRDVDKRTTTWKTTAGLMQVELDQLPEYKPQSRCKVCSAPNRPNGAIVRDLVDELAVVPKTCVAIQRVIEPLMETWPEDARISKYSVMRHVQRHLAWEQTAFRQIAERRAKDSGKVQDAAGRMLTAATVYEVVQQRGFDQIVSGELNPTVKDTLNATAALAEIEKATEGQFSTAYLLSQLDHVIQVIREFIPEDLWPQVVRRLETDESRSPLPPASDPVWDEIGPDIGEGPRVEGIREVQ